MSKPIKLMFNKQRRATLNLLMLHPDERFYVREISRLTGVAAGSLHRELRLLTDAGLLVREHDGNNVYYQANQKSELFAELVAIFHKSNNLTGVLRDAILPLGDRVAAAFMFPSNLDENTLENGEINLFVIGSVSLSEVEGAMQQSAKSLRIVINLRVMRASEFSARMESGDPFINGVMSSSMRFIKGIS